MTFLILENTVVACVFLLLAFPSSRRPLVWGAVWGPAFGFWLISPMLMRIQHLRPVGPLQWACLDLELVFCFSLIGAIAGFIACLPLVCWQIVRRERWTHGDARLVFAGILLLPIGYLALSAVLEWISFFRPPSVERYGSHLGVSTLVALGFAFLASVVYWPPLRQRLKSPSWAVSGVACGLALGGMIAGPARAVGAENTTPVRQLSLATRSANSMRTPLLVVGIDSGNWRTIGGLATQGKLPFLKSLIDRGLQGNVEALWPPYWSSPAWGAIVTGRTSEVVRIHGDLVAAAPGLPRFELELTMNPALDPIFALEFALAKIGVIRTSRPDRSALDVAPVWELLAEAGTKTAAINFPFTYPAGGPAEVVISDRTLSDIWWLAGVRPGAPDRITAPDQERDLWRRWFSTDRTIDDSSLRRILPQRAWPQPRDAVMNPTHHLHTAWNTDLRMLDAGSEVLRAHQDVSALFMFISGFDAVCHAFWQYRFPEDFPTAPPAPADVETLGPVIDRYLEFLDDRLARLVASFPTPPNVIVISDHGHGPTSDSSLWRGFHAAEGLFIAAGPDIPHSEARLNVSYYDLVPTILDLEGFQIPPVMTGVSLRRQFAR